GAVHDLHGPPDVAVREPPPVVDAGAVGPLGQVRVPGARGHPTPFPAAGVLSGLPLPATANRDRGQLAFLRTRFLGAAAAATASWSRWFARYRPVWLSGTVATNSGGPSATTVPPRKPPSRPMSMIQSALLMTSRVCSMT